MTGIFKLISVCVILIVIHAIFYFCFVFACVNIDINMLEKIHSRPSFGCRKIVIGLWIFFVLFILFLVY
jgi:hypothetical protein